MSGTRECFCGCRGRGRRLHHVIYQQELRRIAGRDKERFADLRGDMRGMVPVADPCHAAHHSREKPYELRKLPDSAFAFAEEVLGAGPAYEYLVRRYGGSDPRLTALLQEEE